MLSASSEPQTSLCMAMKILCSSGKCMESLFDLHICAHQSIRPCTHSCRDARAGGAVVPLAVSSGKMPVAAPKAVVKQRRRKGGPELRLCRKFQETGNCTDPNCRLVHGEDDLNRRQEEAM